MQIIEVKQGIPDVEGMGWTSLAEMTNELGVEASELEELWWDVEDSEEIAESILKKITGVKEVRRGIIVHSRLYEEVGTAYQVAGKWYVREEE